MSVIVWIDGAHDAPANMARDGELLACAEAGRLPTAVLRLFTFSPPGITLGRAQVPARELDLARLERAGILWAIRPTGGRAIYHDEEWTFSLTSTPDALRWAGSSSDAYARIGRLLESALRRLGVPVLLAPGSARGVGSPRSPAGAAPPCFASTARHELLLEGRKLAGIAQRSLRGAFLLQGSMLLGDSHVQLAAWRPGGDEVSRAAEAAALLAGSASAGRWLGPDHRLERLGKAAMEVLGAAEVVRGEDGARRLGLSVLPLPA